MMLPHSEHEGASVVLSTAMNGSACCGSGSVGRSIAVSPASLSSVMPRKRAPASGRCNP